MSTPRRRFQSLALLALGFLLVVFGAQRIRAAIGGLFHHEHRVEHRSEHRHADRERDRHRHVRVEMARTAARDVLYDQTFRVREGGRLVVDLGSENVTVRTGSGNRARVIVEGRGWDAAEEFERRRFTARAQGDRLVVRTDPPSRRWSTASRDAQYQVTVEIPRRFSAELDLGSGNVEVGDLRGDLSVDVGSGNVSVASVDGSAAVDTGSGNVQVGAVAGDLEVDTGSGNVQAGRVDGRFSADTGSGRVQAGPVDGPVAVDTGSGRVEVTMARAHPAEIDTGSGSVTVHLPRTADVDVEFDGGSVRLDDAFSFQGARERDEARGRIGRGGPRLHIDTGSGSIALRAR